MSRLSAATLALALGGAALAALGPGCTGGGETNPFRNGTGGHAGATSSSSSGLPPDPAHVWTECQASDQAWVRRAILAIGGRRTWGQAEVNAYTDLLEGLREADAAAGIGGDPGAPPPEGGDLAPARRLVAMALMREDAFRERWSDFVMEALHVVRIEGKSQETCYGPPNPSAVDAGALAAFVRDSDPHGTTAPLQAFGMGQLLSSALELDDLSVVWRAHLFAMHSRPIFGANVDFEAMERNQRQDFGAIFDSAYLHRDVVCLSCHNSEYSVTYDADPAKNRAWPVPGLFEQALFGSSNGMHPPEEEATKGTDFLRAHSMFRVDGVWGGPDKPWGWSDACGSFSVPQSPDPLGIDTYFGSIRSDASNPQKGLYASVWDLERALHRGVDRLAAHGLRREAGGVLADPDEALAYLVAENIVERVWAEVMGTRLTIANYFPRTEVQRDILMGLTEHFVATHFSLKSLLLDILGHPAFNLKAPVEGCGAAPYELPNVFDPWTVSEGDLGKRGNSPADGVFAISSRPLVRSLHRAMEWPYLPEYPPNEEEESLQVALGFFVKDADPGFRGLDFQGRLTWESRYASCADLSGGDFIHKIVAKASATPGATIGDAVIALKDRLLGEPSIEPTGEKPEIEALVGAPLSSTDLGSLDAALRRVCGVLVSTPQFMLGGIPPEDTRDVPKLTPDEISYGATCGDVAQQIAAAGAPYEVTCGSGAVTVTRK